MGFGFVEYKYARHAKDALKTLQGHELHDHALALKASTKTAQGSTERQVRFWAPLISSSSSSWCNVLSFS
eukprot:m.402233 g.402233  ORF g.402233 m.402233 type:complete len:70 (-) comp56449_c0_seq6:543-752(-)